MAAFLKEKKMKIKRELSEEERNKLLEKLWDNLPEKSWLNHPKQNFLTDREKRRYTMKKNKVRLITDEELTHVRKKMLANLHGQISNLDGFLFSIEDVLRFYDVSIEKLLKLSEHSDFPCLLLGMDGKIYFPLDRIINFMDRLENYKYTRKMQEYRWLRQQTSNIEEEEEEEEEEIYDEEK
jgi:hypothetical protein